MHLTPHHKFRVLLLNARTQPSFDQTDDGVDAETSLYLSLHLYLSSPLLHFLLTAHLWSLKLSLKMRVSSNELFSTLMSSRNGCRRSCQHRLCCGIRTVRDKILEDSRNALVVSCGDVQVGDRGRSKETLRALACRRVQLLSARRCTFEHCTSCCPSRDATMVVLTKKKRQTPLTTPRKKIF